MPLLSEYETVAWKKCYASRTSLPPLPQNHHPTAPLKFLCQVRIGGASFSKTSEPSSSFVVLQGGFTKMVLKFVVRLCRTLSTWATTSSRSTLTPTRTDVVLSRARRPRPTMKQAEDAEDAATPASAPAAVRHQTGKGARPRARQAQTRGRRCQGSRPRLSGPKRLKVFHAAAGPPSSRPPSPSQRPAAASAAAAASSLSVNLRSSALLLFLALARLLRL